MSADHLAFARDRVIIISAPNGARRTSKDHQALPITPAELADCAESLLEEGVAVLHLHVRDEELKHSLDDGRYRSAIDAIKTRVGDALILQITTEAVGMYSREHQMAGVRSLRPSRMPPGFSPGCAKRVSGHSTSCIRPKTLNVSMTCVGVACFLKIIRFA